MSPSPSLALALLALTGFADAQGGAVHAWSAASGLRPEEATPRWALRTHAPGCGSANAVQSASALRIDSTTCSSTVLFEQTWMLSSAWSQPYSLEAELRVVPSNFGGGSAGISFNGAPGSCGWQLSVGASDVALRYTNAPEQRVPIGSTAVFRTFRLEVAPIGNRVDLYVDGQPVIIGATGSYPLCGMVERTTVRFGSFRGPLATGPGEVSEWRSIAHTRHLGGYVFCAAEPNSTGRATELYWSGGSSLTNLLFGVYVDPPPPAGSVGILLASRTAATPGVTPAGSSGRLCLGGAIGRFLGPGQLYPFASSAHGTGLYLDLTALAQPNGPVAAAPGESWSFQLWYRDANPQPTSNFSTAVMVHFE